jgi:outer membrane receptor protein involved in Fe transport
VPLSITAASGDQLTRLGITDTSQLEKIVPGFTFQTSQYGTPIYTIRGVGFFDNSVGAGPAVTAYTDQVPLPFAVMTRGAAFDLERVEVLKGPQGTLFGQNSTGGAINYVAAKPTDTLEAGVDLGYGRFNDVDVQGFISGPITDKLTARLALRGEHADGWQRSVTRPDDRLGAQRFVNSRLLVDFEPSDTMRFEFGANAWEDRSDSQAPQFMEFIPGVPPNPSNQYIVDALSVTSPAPADNRAADWRTDFDYENDKRFYQFYLNGAAELSSTVTATSITAYSNYRQNGAQAVDGSAFGNLTLVDNSAQLTSVSQELRLNGGSQPLRWMVGANYQDDESDEDQPTYYQSMSGSILGIVTHTGSFINHQWARTRSAFGSVDYDLNDTVTLQASARYSEQDRRFAGCFVDSGDGVTASAFSALSNLVRGFLEPPGFTPTAIAPGGCVTLNADYTPINGLIHDELNEDNVSWRGSINWKPNTDSLFYANVTKGYKAGSFTIAPAVQASQYFPAKQESVLAYETGFKLGLARRRVQLNGAAFYYDYGDKQVQASAPDPFAGNLNRLVNVPESRIYGAELEATIRPVEPLRLLAGVTFVDSQVQSDPQPPSEAFDPLGNPTTFVGNVFPNTPKWQGVADAEYTYPASNGVNLTFGGTLTYRSSAYAALGQLPNFKIPGYALLDLRAGIESADGVWQVQLYGRNVTDKYYYNGVYRAIDVLSRVTGRPATYGVHLLYRY